MYLVLNKYVDANLAARYASRALNLSDGRVYVVGGAVRDVLLGKEPKDIDLLVVGLPANKVREVLKNLPGRVDLTGKDFGVFRYRYGGHEVEIALPRRERSTGAGHQDFDVQVDHTMSIEDDLARRDFTANAIAFDLNLGEIIDPYNGREDIVRRNLRVVGEHSFYDDPLRIIRALVAYSRHKLVPDIDTIHQMREARDGLTHLPGERIQAELDKIFASPNPAGAIEFSYVVGLLPYIFPELAQVWEFDQNNPHHSYKLGNHLVGTLRNIQDLTNDPDLRLAALLHDIGKPASEWIDPEDGSSHYYKGPNGEGADHALVGTNLACYRLAQLRYPTSRNQRIGTLIEFHMYSDFSSEKGARKFLNAVGEHADDLMTLREADRDAHGTPDHQNKKTPVDTQRELVERVRHTKAPTVLSELAINGSDLIQAGMEPGPEMGKTLQHLVDVVLENPEYNTREKLLELALK